MAADDELDEYIRDCDFPCSRQDLLEAAKAKRAPGEVVHNIHLLPDQEYEDVESVSKAVAVALMGHSMGESPE